MIDGCSSFIDQEQRNREATARPMLRSEPAAGVWFCLGLFVWRRLTGGHEHWDLLEADLYVVMCVG